MNYICHNKYDKVGASLLHYAIEVGMEFNSIGAFIASNNTAICGIQSEDAYRHFARNDDGNGLERGSLTYTIAFSERKPNESDGYRFTQDEREIIVNEYSQFIRDDLEFIVFNHDFFNADLPILREMAERLGVI